MRKLQLMHKSLSSLLLLVGFIIPMAANSIYNDCTLVNVWQSNKINQNTEPPFRLVIDAGHGGKDPGCTSFDLKEKDIALNIALQLGSLVLLKYPEIEVIFTRHTDTFVPLNDRIGIANSVQADLFLSIHCNYFKDPRVQGTETFVMGLHTAEENLEVAKRENASIEYEQDFEQKYDGYDPDSPMGHIILSAFQNLHLDQSLDLADKIEEQFNQRTDALSRGVKQAGFVVLKQATMPAVLVEAGFLSNPEDAQYLSTVEGQSEISEKLLQALSLYITSLDRTQSMAVNTAPQNTTNTSPSPTQRQNQIGKFIQVNQQEPTSHTNIHVDAMDLEASSVSEENRKYRVQIAASVNKPIDQNGSKWQQLEEFDVEYIDGYYKYFTGAFNKMNEALEHKNKLETQGFKGAFIVKN